ncbi:MAG: cadherin-like beta sandwich domain-containing protein, partial [Chloroflexi bacterium]|nr:cadherin-like beta sandwich domain-containing protein [Chloroflexota bacterium]
MKKLARIAMLLAVALCAAAAATDADARNVVLNPPFDPETLSYTATVPYDISRIALNLGAEDPKATVTVNGGDPATPVRLAVGANTIEIVVTAEDVRYRRTYTVVVTRAGAPLSNADLAGLSVEAGADGSFAALDIGAFAAGTTGYAVTVPNGTTHARLTATTANAKAGLKA